MRDSEHAFVLSGGGALGAYEIGVMKALLDHGCDHVGGTRIDPSIYTGNSLGAVNATFMASPKEDEVAGETVDRLERLWTDEIVERPERGGSGVYRLRGDMLPFLSTTYLTRHPTQPFSDLFRDSKFLTSDFARRLFHFFRQSEEPMIERLLEFPDLAAFISTDPLDDLVREHIDLKRVRRSQKKLRVVASDWLRCEPVVFAEGDMTDDDGHDIVLASAAIPAVFPPVEIGDDIYVDGGVTMSTPLKPAIEAWRGGSDRAEHLTVHVVYLDPELEELPLEKVQSTFSSATRLVMIALAHNVSHDIEYARKINQRIEEALAGEAKPSSLEGKSSLTIHRYRPREDVDGVLGLLNFKRDRIEDLIDLGHKDAIHHDCRREGCVLVGEEDRRPES